MKKILSIRLINNFMKIILVLASIFLTGCYNVKSLEKNPDRHDKYLFIYGSPDSN